MTTASTVSAVQRSLSRRLVWALVLAGAVIAATAGWWLLALASALGAGREGSTGYRIVYTVVSLGILADLLLLLVVVIAGAVGMPVSGPWGISPVFLGEAVALGLFAAFWIVQTIETWASPDPAFRAIG